MAASARHRQDRNPLSIPVVAGAVAGVARHIVGSVTGRSASLRITRSWPVMIAGAALLVALEINQQAHADLLRTGPGTPALSVLIVYFAPRIVLVAGAAWALYRRRK